MTWQILGRPDRKMSYFGPRSLASAGRIFTCTRVRWRRCPVPVPSSPGSRATSCARSSRRPARTARAVCGPATGSRCGRCGAAGAVIRAASGVPTRAYRWNWWEFTAMAGSSSFCASRLLRCSVWEILTPNPPLSSSRCRSRCTPCSVPARTPASASWCSARARSGSPPSWPPPRQERRSWLPIRWLAGVTWRPGWERSSLPGVTTTSCSPRSPTGPAVTGRPG